MILLIGDAASCYVASGGVTEGLVALFVVLLHGWVKVVIVQGLPGQETFSLLRLPGNSWHILLLQKSFFFRL